MATGDLSRRLLMCTVRIDASTGGGTGFITSRTRDSKESLFLVTNRHVVEGADRLRMPFLTDGGAQGPRRPKKVLVDVPDISHNCIFHENPRVDIAVIPFGGIADEYSERGTPLRFSHVPPGIYLSERRSREVSAIEDITVVGYPGLLRRDQALVPIVRKGITATPVYQNYGKRRGFLIDAAILDGCSGSPVFIYDAGAYPATNGAAVGSRLVFLGILAERPGVWQRSAACPRGRVSALLDRIFSSGSAIPVLPAYTNLAFVFSAQCVDEAISRAIEVCA